MFVKPLPEVSRVVFICTPHRGSFVAGRTIIEDAVRFLLNPPLPLSSLALDIAGTPAPPEPIRSLGDRQHVTA